ncbi:MAG: type II secretion system F family protein [Geminicoccaceae bacterium]|nr:type II secretion system F family protein [Geminicoccaceae bacterium]MCX7629352.1 type II secretion system F family protein [Geminicoccaceae bacterium]MDW8123566.1 type II secretion system F family protein [Geminicoccaceae bacterium]
MDPSFPALLPWLLFALAAALAVSVAVPAGPDRTLRRRIERIRAREVRRPFAAEPRASLRRSEKTLLGDLGAALSRLLPRTAVLRSHLDRAGLSLAASDLALAAAAAGVLAALFFRWVFGAGWVIAVLAGAFVATAGPTFLLRRMIARREARFLAAFPDAIDLVVRGVKSGLPVPEALDAIARELPEPVSSVFGELCAHLRIGITLPEALALAGERMALPEFRFFAISLVVQQETGGNLAEILHNLSTMIRRRQQMRLKIKAMSSEARASAMIIGALPFVAGTAIFWINPDYISKLFVDPRGWMMLTAGGASMIVGAAVMAKMVRFDI